MIPGYWARGHWPLGYWPLGYWPGDGRPWGVDALDMPVYAIAEDTGNDEATPATRGDYAGAAGSTGLMGATRGTTAAVGPAPDPGVMLEEEFANPVKGSQAGSAIWAWNSGAGAWQVLRFYRYPSRLIWSLRAVDTLNEASYAWDEAENHALSTRINFTLCPSAQANDGLLRISAIGASSRIYEIVYDPVAKTFWGIAPGQAWPLPVTPISTALDGSNAHPISVGTDGNIYHAARDRTSGKIGVVRHTLSGNTYTEYLGLGQSQTTTISHGVAFADGWIYYGFGRNPYGCGAYNVATGVDTVLGTTGTTATNVYQLRYGAKVNLGGTSYWLYQGALHAWNGGVPPWPGASTAEESAWLGSVTAKPTLDETNIEPAPPNPDGTVSLGYDAHTVSYTVPLEASGDIVRVDALANGKVAVFPAAYMGAYLFNPTGVTSDWQGKTDALSPYGADELGGVLYVGGYGNARMHGYSTATAWTPLNPGDALWTVKGDLAPLQFDAVMSVCTMTDRVYSVSQDRRAGGTHGLLVAYRPSDTSLAYLYDPFDGQATDYCVAVGSRYVVISTHKLTKADGSSGLRSALYIYDTQDTADEFAVGGMAPCLSAAITAVTGSKGAGKIVTVSDHQIVGWCAQATYSATAGWTDSTSQSVLYRLNVVTGAIEQSVVIDVRSPWNLGSQLEDNDLTLGPDGWLYAFFGNYLTRIDPDDLTSRTAVFSASYPGQMAWVGNDLYLAGAQSLRRITNAAEV